MSRKPNHDYAIRLRLHPPEFNDAGARTAPARFTLELKRASDGKVLRASERRRNEARGDLEQLVAQLDEWIGTSGSREPEAFTAPPPAFRGRERV